MSLIIRIPADRRARRFVQLFAGLVLFGFSIALMVRSNLGLDPWDVFHQGIARQSGLTIGIITIVISAAVLLLWIPLRQRPGLGTLSNAVLVGAAIDVSLALLPTPEIVAWRATLLGAGIVLNGIATGLYIGAGMGPGPRDGLMTGLASRGHSIRVVRTSIEVSVLGLGWILGGTVGIGTVAYALAIGPMAHITIPAFAVGTTAPATPPDARSSIV